MPLVYTELPLTLMIAPVIPKLVKGCRVVPTVLPKVAVPLPAFTIKLYMLVVAVVTALLNVIPTPVKVVVVAPKVIASLYVCAPLVVTLPPLMIVLPAASVVTLAALTVLLKVVVPLLFTMNAPNAPFVAPPTAPVKFSAPLPALIVKLLFALAAEFNVLAKLIPTAVKTTLFALITTALL